MTRDKQSAWRERFDLIWSLSEIPDYAQDAKVVIAALFEAQFASLISRLEGLRNNSQEKATKIEVFGAMGWNAAMDAAQSLIRDKYLR